MNKDLLKTVIAQNGSILQMIIAMEEMSELTKELSKSIRGFNNRDAVLEEVADVYIMLMQIEIIHGIEMNELVAMIEKKLERLEEGLK